jgi:pimeloyl-ACP methyl ester carboxylesterase
LIGPRWAEADVDVGALRLHVRRVVDPPAPPILLLHGLGVSGSVWQAFARRLGPRFAAVCPDLRGHGASDAPATGYTPADYARDLIGLWGSGPLEDAAPVVGHSLGALVAVALAALRRDLVSAAVLVDPPVDASRCATDVVEVRRLRHAPPGELERYLKATNPAGGDLLANFLAAQFRLASDAAFDALLAAPTGQPDTWAEAAELWQPCLVVQADPALDGALGDEAATRFTASLPHGRLARLAGASHAVHASKPAALAELILDFAG